MLGRSKSPERLGLRLAKDAALTGWYPLLILPSTDAAFRLVAACEKNGMPVKAVGNPGLVATWVLDVQRNVTTPWPLWSAIKAKKRLPCAVAVFEDQLVAIDDSYLRVEINDQIIMVSPIVPMILMKFRPPTYLGSVSVPQRGRACDMSLAPYAPEVPAALSQQAANEIMGEVMRPLLACADDKSISWLARPTFALKLNNNIYRVFVQQIQEMETLVRLCCAARPDPAVPPGWLEVLRASRRELSRQLS